MANIVVNAEERQEFGKNATRRLRSQGSIPGIVYGRSTDPLSIAIDPAEITSILQSDTGHNTIFKLKVGEFSKDVIIRELQLDPVQDTVIHADFQTIAMDRKMSFDVPIDVQGTAEGVKMGGILEIIMREISIECLPADVPEKFSIDASELSIGDTVHVSDFEIDLEKLALISDLERLVLTVVAPTVIVEETEEDEAAEAEEEAAVEAGETDESDGGES